MEKRISPNKMIALLLCGVAGCVFMGGSDWLMIYGDTAYNGTLAWLTAGVSQIPAWRNSLAMALAFPAVILYSIALFAVKNFYRKPSDGKVYSALTAVGLTPWLSLHLFYVMILYAFSWLNGNGFAQEAAAICEAVFAHLSWVIIAGEVLMVLPFCHFIYASAADKCAFSRWMALNNPLLIYVVLKALTGLLPNTPFRLAFTNGLMSESMLIWFGILIAFAAKTKKNPQR